MEKLPVIMINVRLPAQLIGTFLLILVSSCVTTRKTTYLQENEMGSSDSLTRPDSMELVYKLQPGDNLFIRVVTPDPRWAEMFNTLPVTAGSVAAGPESVHLLSYGIQPDGSIHVPFLGAVQVAGFTVPEVRSILEDLLAEYVSEPAIAVKLVNNYVSVLGDVNRPGYYPIYKEQMNVFQALALAGDISDYGNRFEVQIIRQKPDGTIVESMDLTNKNIIDSEFFYVFPNDVIYARPMKGKFFSMGSFPYALIFSTISSTILIYSVITR